MKISKPGIYGLSNEDYHGDICDGPSLSSSGARELVDTCPAKFWFNSYLNPNRPEQEEPRFDIGTAAHTALLEPATMETRVIVIDAENWRTKDAQEQRVTARSAGKTPLLKYQHAEIIAMRDAMYAHPIAKKLWGDGVAEPTYAWRDPITEIWRKARPDFVPTDCAKIIDYKTTSSAEREAFARRVYDHGYYQQGAWNLEAIEAVHTTTPGEFWLVAQETDPPYLVSVYKLGRRAIEWGKLLNRRAIEIFADCVAKNEWPGYGARVEELELPSYAEFALEQRSEAGEFQGSLRAIPLMYEIERKTAKLDPEAWK